MHYNSGVYTFRGARIYLNQRLESKNIIIDNNKIIAITEHWTQTQGTVIELPESAIICPGFVDLHAHFREPAINPAGENLKSGMLAALYGGYQTVCLMANTNPASDNINIIQKNLTASQNFPVRLYYFGAITMGLKGLEPSDWTNLSSYVIGFSDDGHYLQHKNILESILRFGAQHNKLISLHVDDYNRLGTAVVGNNTAMSRIGLMGVGERYETNNLQRDLSLVEAKQLPYHLCHISTEAGVNLIKRLKKNNKKITCEVTPHHLIFNESMIHTDDANWKMNPPLQRITDQIALIDALNKGFIDAIATDHAPHPVDTKTDFASGKMGIIGLETSFASLYTKLVLTDLVKLSTIIDAMTIKPARLIHHYNIDLLPGNLANFTIIDLNLQMEVSAEMIHSQSQNTPLLNETLTGWPIYNILNGVIYNLERKVTNHAA